MTKKSEGNPKRLSVKKQAVKTGGGGKSSFERTRQRDFARTRQRDIARIRQRVVPRIRQRVRKRKS